MPDPRQYVHLYQWQPLVLSDIWGAHAKGYRADDPVRPEGCYHALVLEPDPLRNRPTYQLQVERHTYFWNDGIRTTVPDVLPPALAVVMDAKMQLVPPQILLGVPVEFAINASLPVHVVLAYQIGKISGILGDVPPSLLHKA